METAQKIEKQINDGIEDEMSSDTFTEKLATNIIKNLQVTIKKIHIR